MQSFFMRLGDFSNLYSFTIVFQSNPYALKDNSGSSDMSAWTSASLQSSSGYYSYDPALAAYGYKWSMLHVSFN